jgi:hypothetical protein
VPRELRTIRESEVAEMALTDDQADALAAVGKRLAGRQEWWGADGLADPDKRASAITVQATGKTGRWRIRVNDAVGTVSVGDLQLTIRPKIPEHHLVGLLTSGGSIPRLDETAVGHSGGDDLWDVVATWFLAAAEGVVRADLARDYRTHRAERPYLSGRVDLVRTTVNISIGRLAIASEAEEYDHDSPLNRVLLAAIRVVQTSPVVAPSTRRRAGRLASRFLDVSAMAPGDLESLITDRRTSYYSEAIALARHLLRGTALTLGHGQVRAWAFLVRTPEPVESGLRRLLQDELVHHAVEKRGRAIGDGRKTLNPDLVFDEGHAVGDVKYKIQKDAWSNDDLYQLVAFATGYRADRGLLVSFSTSGQALKPLDVGPVQVSNVVWNSHPERTYLESADEYVRAVQRWLDRWDPTAP